MQLPTLPVSSGPVKKQIRKSGKLNELKAESKVSKLDMHSPLISIFMMSI